ARFPLRQHSENTPAYPLRRSLMKTRMLAILAFSLLGIPTLARAQEGPRMPKPETLPPPKEAALPEPPCGTRVLWMEYTVAVQTIHAPKDDFIRIEKISTYEIGFKEEERSFPTTVLKPREVSREETVCCMEPVTTVDPVTGHQTTCTQQVTRTRVVKDVVFEA